MVALAATNAVEKQRALDALHLLTLVKDRRLASVVLATTEHGLPRRLQALGYNSDHIDKVIVAEEVPPAIMKDLLMGEWGCGEHLATALCMLYGGHVMYASAAVCELAASTNREALAGMAALGTMIGNPARCLNDRTFAAGVPAEQWEGLRKRVRAALAALARDGFVPLDSDQDEVAQVISLTDAGLVVGATSVTSVVPPHAWTAPTASNGRPAFCLVPSSHIMRLLFARKTCPLPPQGSGAGVAPLA